MPIKSLHCTVAAGRRNNREDREMREERGGRRRGPWRGRKGREKA